MARCVGGSLVNLGSDSIGSRCPPNAKLRASTSVPDGSGVYQDERSSGESATCNQANGDRATGRVSDQHWDAAVQRSERQRYARDDLAARRSATIVELRQIDQEARAGVAQLLRDSGKGVTAESERRQKHDWRLVRRIAIADTAHSNGSARRSHRDLTGKK